MGEGSQSYELNEGFISHFAGEGAVSMENYRSLRLAAEKIYQTDQVVFIYGIGIFIHDGRISGKKLLVLGIKCIFSDGA